MSIYRVDITLTGYDSRQGQHVRVLLFKDDALHFTYIVTARECNSMNRAKLIAQAQRRKQDHIDKMHADARKFATPHRPTAAAA